MITVLEDVGVEGRVSSHRRSKREKLLSTALLVRHVNYLLYCTNKDILIFHFVSIPDFGVL